MGGRRDDAIHPRAIRRMVLQVPSASPFWRCLPSGAEFILELLSVSHSCISCENKRWSQSHMNWVGMDPISLQYCWRAGRMSWDKSLSGNMALYLVALSMRYNAYLICPCAVADPYRISIWTISPNFVGRVKGVVFLLDLSTVEVLPMSNIGSWSDVDME